MNNNITFLIQRLNHFKTLGPLIDEALKQGLNVNLLIFQVQPDYIADEMFGGVLEKNNIPKFKFGQPTLKYISKTNQIASTVINLKTDVFVQHQGIVVDNAPSNLIYEHYKMTSNLIIRVAVMSHFYDNCYEDLEFYQFFDKCFILSQYSYDVHKKILLKSKRYTNQEVENVFKNKIEITGSALFDNFLDIYNYRKKNKSKKKDVILLTPKNNHPYLADVVKYNSKFLSILNSLFLKKGIYLVSIIQSINLKTFISNLYKKIKTNNMSLIIKSRIKHKDEKLLSLYKNNSDIFVSGKEDRYYPNYTSALLMKNAYCIIGYQSGTVMEAVISGIPVINIQVPLKVNSSLFNNKKYARVNKYVRNSENNNLFNFKGCVWSLEWKNAKLIYNDKYFEKLKIDEKGRKKYIEKFCGIKNKKSALIQINLIKNLSKNLCNETSKFLRNYIGEENKFLKYQNYSPSPFWRYDIVYKKNINIKINNLLKKYLNFNIVRTTIQKDRSTLSFNKNNQIENARNKQIIKKIKKFAENLKLKVPSDNILNQNIINFNEIYRKWPYDLNGSINYNSALHLFIFIKLINPDEVLESGSYRGFSTYIIDNAVDKKTTIHSFDLNFSNLKFKSDKVIYYEKDIFDSSIKFHGKKKIAFFDDHCDHFSRLQFSKEKKFKYCIFDDDVNFFNMHSDGTPPLPTLNMLMDKNLSKYNDIEWLCNGRNGKLNFSEKLKLNKKNYIYYTPEDLFDLTGIKRSSITSFLIHKNL